MLSPDVRHVHLKVNGEYLGVYQDVALGSSAAGFDAWAFPELFVQGGLFDASSIGLSEAVRLTLGR